MIASQRMFDKSEWLHPVQEAEKIKVENIRGKIIFVGAEDDALWDTAKYIRRMVQRLETQPHECKYEALLYEHGTHFVFPQSLLNIMLPVVSGVMVRLFRAGRQHAPKCKQYPCFHKRNGNRGTAILFSMKKKVDRLLVEINQLIFSLALRSLLALLSFHSISSTC